MFDNIPALAPPKPTKIANELDTYLADDIEKAADPVAWWYERRAKYPNLLRMAISYLTIPGMSIVYSNQFSCTYGIWYSDVCRR